MPCGLFLKSKCNQVIVIDAKRTLQVCFNKVKLERNVRKHLALIGKASGKQTSLNFTFTSPKNGGLTDLRLRAISAKDYSILGFSKQIPAEQYNFIPHLTAKTI
jgi:hypothetical protein